MKRSILSRKEGSAMVGAILIAIVIGTWVAASVSSTFNEYKLSKRYFDTQNALNLAESGLEEGIRLLQSGDWASEGWTAYGSGYSKSFAPTISDGVSAAIDIFVYDDSSAPVIVAEGRLLVPGGKSISKQLRVDMSASSSSSNDAPSILFANSLLARDRVTFQGNNVLIDSYDSRLGDWTPLSNANRFSNSSVVSLSVNNTDIDINNANVYGFVATAAKAWYDKAVGKNGVVGSYGSTGVDGSRITTDFYADLPDVVFPDFSTYQDLPDITSSRSLGESTDVTPKEYKVSSLSLASTSSLTINGPVRLYVSGNFSMTGQSTINMGSNGSLEVFAGGDFKIAGNGMASTSKKPSTMLVFGGPSTVTSQSIQMGGNGKLWAVVYAPNSTVSLGGGGLSGSMHGAIVGKTILLNGHWNFHYDEALKEFSGGGSGTGGTGARKFALERWRELKSPTERVDFANPAGITAEL